MVTTLTASGLVFGYREGSPILTSASLRATAGQLTAVVGPNGAGKSTLLTVLAGLRKPWNGRVSLDERDLASYRPAGLARVRAYLSGPGSLQVRYTVREVVEMGGFPWSGSGVASDLTEQVLSDFELDDLADRPFSTLSSGEARRVLVARTLAQKTGVVILDEPVSGLDIRHTELVLRVLSARARSGSIVVVVLHDLNAAARHADSVALVVGGGVVQGNADEVLTAEAVSAAYGIPIEVSRSGTGLAIQPQSPD